jgi:hypothetical protein
VGVIKPITRDAETSPVTKKDDAEKEVIVLKKEDRDLPFLKPVRKTLTDSVKKELKTDPAPTKNDVKTSSVAEKTSKYPPSPTMTW